MAAKMRQNLMRFMQGVGLSWRKDADEEAMHFVEDKSGALPQKRVGRRGTDCA